MKRKHYCKKCGKELFTCGERIGYGKYFICEDCLNK